VNYNEKHELPKDYKPHGFAPQYLYLKNKNYFFKHILFLSFRVDSTDQLFREKVEKEHYRM